MNFKFVSIVVTIMSMSCSTIGFAMVEVENDERPGFPLVKKPKDKFEDYKTNNEESLSTMLASILEKLEREIQAHQKHTQDVNLLIEEIDRLNKESIRIVSAAQQ